MSNVAKLKKKAAEFELKRDFAKALAVYVELLDNFDQEVVEKRTLKVPHPEMHKRRFVLLPLAELAPHVVHPQLGQSVSALLATVKDAKRVTLMPRT